MHIDHDPAAWAPAPVRPRWQLALRFAATVVCLPLLCALWLTAWGALIVLGAVVEVIALVIPPLEAVIEELTEKVLEGLLRLGGWFVTWPELRHEGDSGYYRARVDRRIADWTARASIPPRESTKAKAQPPTSRTLSLRDYRGVGAGYVAEAARAQGWELRPSDVRREVHLRWSAAPQGAFSPLRRTPR